MAAALIGLDGGASAHVSRAEDLDGMPGLGEVTDIY
jgi:hypothetical protein